VTRGAPWEESPGDQPPQRVAGLDAELALAAQRARGRAFEFVPDESSDLARVLGLTPGRAPVGERVVALDGLWCVAEPGDARLAARPRRPAPPPTELLAINTVVLGTPPDHLGWWARAPRLRVEIDGRVRFAGRASGVVVANGEFLRGHDVAPCAHPGDGHVEVQVYALRRDERIAMRQRLATGDHVPHPRIFEHRGRSVEIAAESSILAFEADAVPRAPTRRLSLAVLPNVARVLV